MKLTNTIRNAFVRAAMADVPSVDYDEQIRSLAHKVAVDMLPPKVRAVYNDKALRSYVATQYVSRGCSVNVPGVDRDALSKAIETAIEPLVEKRNAQRNTHADLSDKLRAVAYSVSTRAALAKALPEFEKYLPADEQAALRSVPTIANVVSEFTKAGWPKGTKTAKQEALA